MPQESVEASMSSKAGSPCPYPKKALEMQEAERAVVAGARDVQAHFFQGVGWFGTVLKPQCPQQR